MELHEILFPQSCAQKHIAESFGRHRMVRPQARLKRPEHRSATSERLVDLSNKLSSKGITIAPLSESDALRSRDSSRLQLPQLAWEEVRLNHITQAVPVSFLGTALA
jgi:hypothetical protein